MIKLIENEKIRGKISMRKLIENFPSKEVVERLRRMYPAGTRIELISMNDPYTKLIPGDRGTVEFVDDIGTIHVRWDCGSGLGVAYDEDVIRKI